MKRIMTIVRYREPVESWHHLREFYTPLGIYLSGCGYEVDHIVPRVWGGGNELANLRTLCIPDHKGETARLAAERAAERQDAKRPLLTD